jgi:hypothetical protein
MTAAHGPNRVHSHSDGETPTNRNDDPARVLPLSNGSTKRWLRRRRRE